MKAYDSKNNLYVEIVSVSGGWTTVMSGSGVVYKLRNSCVEVINEGRYKSASDDELEDEDDELEDEDDELEDGFRRIVKSKFDPSCYAKVKAASGNASLDCADSMAVTLRGKSLDDVYELAAVALAISEEELRTKYEHLNPGMQRMTLGNRMRHV